MKILIVAESAGPRGGAEKVAVATALALADRGHEVTLLGGCGPVAQEVLAHPSLRHVVVYDSDPGEPEGRLEKLQALWKKHPREVVKEELERLGPEGVVHIHGAYFVLSPSVYGPLLDHGRVVYTHHEYGMACPTMGFYDYKRDCVCPERGGSLGCIKRDCVIGTRRIKTIATLRHGLAFRLTHAVRKVALHIFVGEFSRDILRPYLPADARCEIVRNPADLVDDGPSAIADDAPFVFVGRLTIEKGPNLLCEACRRIGASLALVGDGPLRESIERDYPEVRVTGWLTAEEVRQTVRSSRALVIPSKWFEGLPLVAGEALSQGIPLVVSDACAGTEAIVEEVTGVAFHSEDAEDLAEKLRTLTADRAREMGEAAYRRFWVDPQDRASYAARLEALYKTL